jgi:hypothetical protein
MAVELVNLFAILVVVRRFHGMRGVDNCSLRSDTDFRMKDFVRRYAFAPSHRFLGDVGRDFMQRLSVVLHGTLGFYLYLRNALEEGSVHLVACLPFPLS